MRTIEDHKVNPANDSITITVTDEPGSGGANHAYEISGVARHTNPSYRGDPIELDSQLILFQNGPITEAGPNGITHEVLLSIVLDRLRSFQRGQYASRENALAITNIEQGLHWLQQRTLRRMRQGIEGTHAPDPRA